MIIIPTISEWKDLDAYELYEATLVIVFTETNELGELKVILKAEVNIVFRLFVQLWNSLHCQRNIPADFRDFSKVKIGNE